MKLPLIFISLIFQAYVEKHSLKEPSAKKKGLILLSDKMTCKKIHSDYKAYSLLDPGKVETITLFSLQQEINHNIILSEIVNILYKILKVLPVIRFAF